MYRKITKELLKGRAYDPRHIEGYMRLAHGTLDSLSHAEFKKEVELCINAIDYGGKEEAEKLAKSYGL